MSGEQKTNGSITTTTTTTTLAATTNEWKKKSKNKKAMQKIAQPESIAWCICYNTNNRAQRGLAAMLTSF